MESFSSDSGCQLRTHIEASEPSLLWMKESLSSVNNYYVKWIFWWYPVCWFPSTRHFARAKSVPAVNSISYANTQSCKLKRSGVTNITTNSDKWWQVYYYCLSVICQQHAQVWNWEMSILITVSIMLRNCVAWYLCVLTSSLVIYYKCKYLYLFTVSCRYRSIDKSPSRSHVEHKDWAQKWDQVRSLQSDEILSRQCPSAPGPHTGDMPCNIFAVCKYSATFSPASWLA